MAVQIRFRPEPEFDKDGYCLTCGKMANLAPGIDLFCDRCPDPGPEGLFARHIDQEATAISNDWDEFSKMAHDLLMAEHRTQRQAPRLTEDPLSQVMVAFHRWRSQR